MKTIVTVLMILTTSSALARENATLQLNAQQYGKLADGMVRAYTQKGRTPTAEDVLRLRTLEHQMLALATLNPSLADQTPAAIPHAVRNPRPAERAGANHD